MSGFDVSSLWIGGRLGWVEQMCLASFVQAGASVSLYTYETGFVVPTGVELRDAREILPQEQVFENTGRPGTFAGFSNIFRYRLLQLVDTTWIDTDVLSTGRPLPSGDYLFGWESRHFINGAILRAPRDSDFLKQALEYSLSIAPEAVKWGQLGPRLVTSTATNLRLDTLAQSRTELYPIGYRKVWKLFDPSHSTWVRRTTRRASTIHLWNEVMRGHPVKSSRPPEGSFVSNFAEGLGIDLEGMPDLSLNWVRDNWRKQIDPRPLEAGFLDQRAGRVVRYLKGLRAVFR